MVLAIALIPLTVTMAKIWKPLLLVTYCICLFVCQFPSSYATTAMAKSSTKLYKKHLVVLISEYPVSLKILRNATGHVIQTIGASPLMLNWLSRLYKFDYSLLDVNVTTLEDGGPNLPGIISYATRGECDVILAVIRQTPERLRFLELLHPWMYSQAAFIIPMPEVSHNNVDAVIKPFQLWVWMALILALASVIAVLSCFKRLLQSKGRSAIEQDNPSILPSVRVTESIFMYVVGTLLNQGGYISNTFTPIRLVVGAWCLLTLVLLNVYNGVLISYVTEAGRPQPLINAFEDVLSDSILLVLDKGLAGDIVFSTAEKGLYKVMNDKLKAHPNSRCLSTQQCIDLVKSLPPRYVYLNAVIGLKSAIKKDYIQTRQCKLTIAGEPPFMKQATGWGLAKNSPYREEFNRGTARLFDVGLTSLWQKWYEPDSKPCYDDNDNGGQDKNKKKPLVRLSLTNLTGAFAVLAVGCAMSILTFLTEIIIFLKKESKKK